MEEILHQLIGSLSHHLQGFIHIRWCRISSINSMDTNTDLYMKIRYSYEDIRCRSYRDRYRDSRDMEI